MAATASPDIIFAQKATAIVKAAGLDPKAIDLETFRKWAPIIFTRAYSAIYKEQLISDLNEYSSKEEQVLNAQLVIDGLTTKTRNPALATISGIDVYQGNHRAIGIVVGILFAEGQRLWLEKVKQIQRDQNCESPMRGSPHSAKQDSSNVQFSPPHNKKTSDFNADQHREEDDQHDSEEQMMAKLQKLYQTNQNASPRELEKLLNRIAYLENRLRRSSKAKSHDSRRSRSRSNRRNNSQSPKRRSKTRSGSPVYTKHEEGLFDDDGDGSDDISASESVRGDYERRVKTHMDDINKQKKQRPSSAPTVRRVKHVSSRLYRPPLNKNTVEAHPNNNHSQPSKPIQARSAKPTASFDDEAHEQYTYDLKTGRRILLSVAQMQMEERRRQQAAMGNVASLAKAEDDTMGNKNANRDSSPTSRKAEYPGRRTEKSVEEWLEKMRKQLPNAKPEPDPLPRPVSFDMYQNMDALDLVVSIEHCHNCQHHNISLRHDPNEYTRQADEFLRIVGQAVFQSGFCVRLGVVRIAANVTPKSKTTDTDSRIGAFEIQAACKNSKGEDLQEVIHSKLQSRRWPSKSVLEKRLTAFLSKTAAPSFCRSDEVENFESTTEVEGSQTYPGGRCQWEDTALSQSSWSYGRKSAQSTTKRNDAVQWIFDARALADQPKFAIGSTVWVQNVVFANSCVEKYALLGVVKRNCEGGGTSVGNTKSTKKLVVRLKYCNQIDDFEVLESDCSGLRTHGPNGTNNHVPITSSEKDPKLPFDLEGLLLLGKSENCIAWRIIDNEDYLNKATSEVFLCRNSYFRQVRSLSWNVILRFRGKGVSVLQHPVQTMPIDPFNNYSEYMLDYIFKQFATSDGLLNVTRLMLLLPKSTSVFLPVEQKNDISHDSKDTNVLQAIPKSANNTPRSARESLNVNTTKEISLPPNFALDKKSDLLVDSTQIDKGGVHTVARPSIAKPSLTRPSMLIKRPSLEDIDKIFPDIFAIISHKNMSDKTEVLNAFKSTIQNKAIRSDDGILHVSIDQFILILHDFGLENVADNGASMKSLSTYFSTDGKTNSIKAEEFIGWLDKNSRSGSKQRSPRLSSAETTQGSALLQNSGAMDLKTAEIAQPRDSQTVQASMDTKPANTITSSEPENTQILGNATNTDSSSPRPVAQPPSSSTMGIQPRTTIAPKKQYQNKDLVISSIILEGAVLIHANYDSVYVTIEMENRCLDAKVCLARERGSKRRSFNVNWGEIGVSAGSFSDKNATLCIFVSDNEVVKNVPTLPHPSSTTKGQSPNSILIPMFQFFESSFEIKSTLKLPLFGSDNVTEGSVSVIIHGHAHEAKEARKTRIMSMKPVELLSLRFEPLPVDDDDASANASDDEDSAVPSVVSKNKTSNKNDEESTEINETLFPKPSMHNLLVATR